MLGSKALLFYPSSPENSDLQSRLDLCEIERTQEVEEFGKMNITFPA